MWKRRAAAPAFAQGYPQTDAVTAQRMRSSSDFLRRSGPVVLTNGDNSFAIDVTPFKRVSVEPGEGGAFDIVGLSSLAARGDKAILASFGSQQAARNGYASLMRVYAGIKVPGTRGMAARSLAMLKWPVGLAGVFVLVALFGVFGGPATGGAAVAAELGGGPSPQQDSMLQQQPQVAGRNSAGGAGFDANEPTLEDLAAGKYNFQPKLKAPDVQAPTLNCAPHGDPAK